MRFEKEINIYGDEAVLKRFQANETSIAIVQGNISAIISESELVELQDSSATMYSKLASAVMDIESLTLNFSDLTTKYNTVSGQYTSLNSLVAQYKASVDGLSADITQVSQNLSKNYSTTSQMNTAINAKANEITSSVSATYATKNQLNNYSTTSQMNSAISQKANEITASASNTYATKSALNTANGKISALESWRSEASLKITDSAIISTVTSSSGLTTKVNSLIEQKADDIRMKATTISWESTYSSMTADGKLTCTGAQINGEFRSDYSGVHGNEFMHIKEGRLLGGIDDEEWGVLDLAAQYEGEGKHILLSGGNAVLHLRGTSIQLHGNTYSDDYIQGKLHATNGDTKSIPVITAISYKTSGGQITEISWTTKMVDVQNGIVINIQD